MRSDKNRPPHPAAGGSRLDSNVSVATLTRVPRPPVPDARTTTVQVRLSDAEVRRLDLLRDGQSRSAFLRRPLVDVEQPAPPPPRAAPSTDDPFAPVGKITDVRETADGIAVTGILDRPHRHTPASIFGRQFVGGIPYGATVCGCGEPGVWHRLSAVERDLPDFP